MISFSKVTLLLIFIILLNSYGISSSNLDYLVSGFILFYYILKVNSFDKKLLFIDSVPFIFIFVWLFGFSLGLINGATLYSAFFNFPGMLLLLLYFPFHYAKIKFYHILKIFSYSTFLINLLVCYTSLSSSFTFDVLNLMRSRQYYSVGLILQVICLSFSFIKKKDSIFLNSGKYFYYFIKANSILSFVVLLFSFSKGFWLSAFTSVFFIGSLTFLYNFKKHKISKSNIALLIGIPVIVLFISITNPFLVEGVKLFFDFDVDGNKIRLEQAGYLKNEFTFLGAGFVVPLKSGYMRDYYGFAFELSYYNIIHKIGIFSIFIFSIYIYLFFFSIKYFLRFGPNFISIFAISSLTYLISASGNPILFSSLNMVILTIILVQFKHILKKNLNEI